MQSVNLSSTTFCVFVSIHCNWSMHLRSVVLFQPMGASLNWFECAVDSSVIWQFLNISYDNKFQVHFIHITDMESAISPEFWEMVLKVITWVLGFICFLLKFFVAVGSVIVSRLFQ